MMKKTNVRMFFCLLFFSFVLPVQSHELSFTLNDLGVCENQSDKYINIYFNNLADTIAGMVFQLEISPAGIAEFGSVGSSPVFDTSGTLLSGWEYISAYSVDGDKQDILLIALANMPSPPFNYGFLPQQGGKLIKIRYHLLPIADSIGTIQLNLKFNNDNFSMCPPSGRSLGIKADTIINCLEYQGEVCIRADTTIESYLDTSIVYVRNAVIDVHNEEICGDLNSDGKLNLLDILCQIRWFKEGESSPGCSCLPIDINNDAAFNILDILYLITYLYGDTQ
jgi:hypothetical protein